MRTLFTTAAFGLGTLLAGTAFAATVNQGTGYALDSTGFLLTTYTDLANPEPPTDGVVLREGTVITSVDAIAYRPNTQEFFAYRDSGDLVYNLDVGTGALTAVTSGMGNTADGRPIATSTRQVGFDFNNALDAARIVSTEDENLVFFPTPTRDPAEIIRANDLFYVPGDANAGANPSIFANAYTQAVAQAQTDGATQVQYALDSDLDVLTTLGNNTGELRTIGKLVVDGMELDFTEIGGFDILSPTFDDNLGLALLNVGGNSNLYSFNLPGAMASGPVEATFVSSFGRGFGAFAVAFNGQASVPAPVPLPASALLLLAGMGGLGALRRFGRKA